MKKSVSLSNVFFTFVVLIILLTAGIKAYGEQNVEDNNGYEKWSRIAISSVKDKYPEAQLIDYKYVKREAVNDEESKDTFHIKVKDKEEVFVENVDVVFNPKTGKLITVNGNKEEDAPGL